MKKQIILIIFCLSVFIFLNNKTKNVEEPQNLFPFKINNKWGFINNKGQVIIEPKFLKVSCFSKGLAVIWESDFKFGYIDKTGKYIWNPTE